ncbi:amphi-Trp domain-containing protein [Mariprofundus ferrooxydans]|nr:amphi-Trp domain-containing protein [Mariprofundus ferrooxydans]
MQHDKDVFRHESLQESKTIRKLLTSITDGLEKGELTFSDGDHQIIMSPNGLLHLKLSASKEDGRNRVNIRVTWQDQSGTKAGKNSLKING